MVNSINQSLYLSDYKNQTRNTGQSVLDQDAFLKILITQLQNQDPSNPMDDKEFIGQMAAFSSLEQMTQMNKTLTNFIEMQKDSHFLSHSQMIGKEIKWEQIVTDAEGETKIVEHENKVNAISFQNGKTRLVLDNGETIDTIQVIHIGSSSTK